MSVLLLFLLNMDCEHAHNEGKTNLCQTVVKTMWEHFKLKLIWCNQCSWATISVWPINVHVVIYLTAVCAVVFQSPCPVMWACWNEAERPSSHHFSSQTQKLLWPCLVPFSIPSRLNHTNSPKACQWWSVRERAMGLKGWHKWLLTLFSSTNHSLPSICKKKE